MIPGGLTLTESRAHLAATLAKRSDRCAHGFATSVQHCPDCAPDEWQVFLAALKSSVRDDGSVHQCDVRPKLRGRIEPKHIGLAWKRARRDGLVVEVGFERSNDTEGRNGHRMEAVYEWAASASAVAA